MVYELLVMSNYPSKFITNYIYRKRVEIRNRNNNNYDFNKDIEFINRRVISIPYYGDISENIKRLFKHINVRIVFRSESRLNTFIKTGKDPSDCLNRKNVIYRFSALVENVI